MRKKGSFMMYRASYGRLLKRDRAELSNIEISSPLKEPLFFPLKVLTGHFATAGS